MTATMQPTSFARQPLDAILSGTGSVRILRALAAHGGALSVSRLAADTNMTPNGTRGVLNDLEQTGVVEALGDGRTKLFRLKAAHPLAATLEYLFAAERSRFDSILYAIEGATKDNRITSVWLFGSVARSEDTCRSDLDIAILVNAAPDEVERITDIVREALHEHEKRIGFTASVVAMHTADVRDLIRQRAPLWSDLLRDAQVIKGPPPDRVARELEATTTPAGRA